jgi:hypothetical protein
MKGRRHSIDRTGPLPRDRTRTRPGLEPLEGRLVLSTTYTVTTLADVATAGQTTLRQAITSADSDGNANPASPDVINFAIIGDIALNSALPAISGALAIEGPGASSLTIGLASTATNLTVATLPVAAGADASLSGLTVVGPNAEAITLGAGASLSAQGVTFQKCGLASNGGNPAAAILDSQGGGTITIQGCAFSGDYGDPITDDGATSLTIANSTFSNGGVIGDAGAVLGVSPK